MSREDQKKVVPQKTDKQVPQKEEKLSVKKTTLVEFGQKLPVPINTGKDHHGFEILRWNFKKEKELGALRTEEKAGLGRYTSMVVATMCSRVGPHNFEKMSFNERLLYLSSMPMGTVFYIYSWLRYKSLGKELGMKIDCTRCMHSFEFEADLETLEVRNANSIEAFYWDYELKEPFNIRGKEATGFKVGPPTWSTTEEFTDKIEGTGVMKESVIRGSVISIVGIDDGLGITSDFDLDEMGKRDIELLSNKIEENYLGPDMTVAVKCEKCKSDIEGQINWGYDNFFGISSR